MNYSEFIAFIDDPKLLLQRLKKSTKDGYLNLLQDYYDGKQWYIYSNGESRTTRSGRIMWKSFGKNPFKGYTRGELKTWNIIKPAVNIYAKYVRGEDTDNVKIVIKEGKTVNKELGDKAMEMFNDLNIFVGDAARKNSISSIIITKFTPLTKDENGQYSAEEKEILKKIRLESTTDTLEGTVELIDPKEVEPIYWNGELRGVIRYYIIDKAVAAKDYGINDLKNDPYYIECWYIDDSGKVSVMKYVNTREVENGEAPYEFIPYRIQVNRKRTDGKRFDATHLEESDVEELVELQDDLNSFVTDLGVIYRQVAIPMLKMTDEFIKEAKSKDIEKVKKNIQELTTYAGQILFAPVERMREAGVSESQVRFILDIREQYHIITNIPKSVFNSEGLANIAAETLEHLFESLAKVIGEKRTAISKIIVDNVKMYLMHNGKFSANTTIEVVWPNMFSMSAADRIKVIQDSFTNDILPVEYVLELILDELGDYERYEEIKAILLDAQAQIKQQAETRLALESIRASVNTTQPTVNNRDLQEINNGNSGNNQQNTRPA